jgi:hypothetical protein
MFPADTVLVEFAAQGKYEVTFYITQPKRVRTTEVVSANSSGDARKIIEARYGKGEVQIVLVKKLSS